MHKTMRWLFVISILAFVAAVGWWGYQRFTSQVTLRVVVPGSHSDAVELLSDIGTWLKQNGKRTRIDVIQVASEAEAAQAVVQRKADLAALRADQPIPAQIASMVSLYKDVAIFVVPPGSPVKSWGDLKGRSIGLVGATAQDDPLLAKVLKLGRVENVKFIAIKPNGMIDSIARKEAQIYASIRPIMSETADDSRRLRSLKAIKGKASLLEVADTEAAAETDNRYEAYDIPAGALRQSPPLPEEAVGTLAVARHLFIAKSVPALFVQRTVIDIIDAKRALGQHNALARQIGSPGAENDSAVPIHSGALHYFNGDEMSLVDMVIEWIYIIPMVIGGLGAVLTWLYNRLWPAERMRAQRTMEDLLVMRREATRIITRDELSELVKRRDALQEEIDAELADGGLEDRTVTALLVAADAADRKIDAVEARIDREERERGGPQVAAATPPRLMPWQVKTAAQPS